MPTAVEFLGYDDSGMMGEPTNDDPRVLLAGRRRARRPTGWPPSSREVGADVLTIYDDHGGYGHPDHIQVHRVGRAGRPSWPGSPLVFQATMNRDAILRAMRERAAEFAAIEERGPRAAASTRTPTSARPRPSSPTPST